MATYRVLREHEGDRFYREGDARELDPGEAAHLETLGVLERVDGGVGEKSEPSPQNKSEAKPANKAGRVRAMKGA